MIVILNNPWVKESLRTWRDIIGGNISDNIDDPLTQDVVELMAHYESKQKDMLCVIVALLMLKDLGCKNKGLWVRFNNQITDFFNTVEVDKFRVENFFEHLDKWSDMLKIDRDEDDMVSAALESFFRDAFLFMLSKLRHIEIASEEDAILFHFGEQ